MRYLSYLILLFPLISQSQPFDNPVRTRFGDDVALWTDTFQWQNVVNINDFEGEDWVERFNKAQEQLKTTGGGVIFFPSGTYHFKESLLLQSNMVIRGEEPKQIRDAWDGEYTLTTRFEFPEYSPNIGGDHNRVESAFKGIRLQNPHSTTHCGVVNVDVNHGHIKFGADIYNIKAFVDNFDTYGRNHLVFGCIIRNAAIADPTIPREWQKPWQIWTHRHNAAIDIRAAENVLVANNRIPQSGDEDFLMPGYVVKAGSTNEGKTIEREDVTFRYDNRPGIYVNYGSVTGSPEEAPHCYIKGIDVRDNYIYNYGCMGIGVSGDGAYVGGNVIRFGAGNYLPIYNGVNMSHHVNNNRAIELRALRWTVEYNNYEVYSNTQPDTTEYLGRYNDGEGIMHEQHDNVPMIIDSKLRYNVGNRYLSIWRTPVDGLEIVGNIIRTSPNDMAFTNSPAICIQGQVHLTDSLLPVRNVKIIGNITGGTGIRMLGLDKGGNRIENNHHFGPGEGLLELSMPEIPVDNNGNYTITQKIRYGAGN